MSENGKECKVFPATIFHTICTVCNHGFLTILYNYCGEQGDWEPVCIPGLRKAWTPSEDIGRTPEYEELEVRQPGVFICIHCALDLMSFNTFHVLSGRCLLVSEENQHRQPHGISFASCIGGPGFDFRLIQTNDFNLVVEVPKVGKRSTYKW